MFLERLAKRAFLVLVVEFQFSIAILEKAYDVEKEIISQWIPSVSTVNISKHS